MTAKGDVLLPGAAVTAKGLALTAPISFWGGVDARTGTIADPRHPEHGAGIAGTGLMIPLTVGSSLAAAILLAISHGKRAPAAVVLHEPDAILLLGLIVAKEMGWETPIAIRLDRDQFAQFHDRAVTVSATGEISSLSPS